MDLVRSWDGYSTQERSIDPFHHGLDETELFGRSSDREDVGGLFNGDRNSLRLRWPSSAPVAEELPKLGRDGGRWPGGALVFVAMAEVPHSQILNGCDRQTQVAGSVNELELV